MATVVPQAEESAQLLVDLADAAPYEAKGAGRNAFVAAAADLRRQAGLLQQASAASKSKFSTASAMA